MKSTSLKTLLPLAIAALIGLPASATPLTISTYSTALASATSSLYKDTSYTGQTLTAAPLVSYSGGTGKLTDGVTTGGNPWVAWYGESGWPSSLGHPTLIFDFGASAAVDEVSLYFWRFTTNLIRLPTAIHVDYSDDGITYGGAQNFSILAGAIPDGSTGWLNFSLDGNGRYARVILDNVGRDTFMSEVKFEGSMNPTGVPDPVSTAMSAGLAMIALAIMRRQIAPAARS